MINKFFWLNGSKNSRGIIRSKWEDLCEKKQNGGMGFKNLELFSTALLGKMGWRLLTDSEALVCRVLKAKYFLRNDYLSAPLGRNPTLTWRNIWHARDLVRKGTRWRIGCGESIRVWGTPWLNSNESFYIQTLPVFGFEDLMIFDLIVSGTYL